MASAKEHAASTAGRLAALRKVLAQHHLDAAVVLTSDPHLSEYLPGHWQVRQWLTGFEGSAGTVVVTARAAALWVDSRYWEQAEYDLEGTAITLMRAGQPNVDEPQEWLAKQLTPGMRVWMDARIVPMQQFDRWQKRLKASGLQWVGEPDVFSALWQDRPALPAQPVYTHQPPFACRTLGENLLAVRERMAGHGADFHFLSSLDDIAWIFNLRGSDIPFNPVFLSYALIGKGTAQLFIDEAKVSSVVAQELASQGVRVLPYEQALASVRALPRGTRLLFDPTRTTKKCHAAFTDLELVSAINPSQILKACKSDAEIENIRRTMLYDGVALCEFFAWFEEALGHERITELTIDERLSAARSRQPHFVSSSFSTIAAFNANGAMPHYQASPERHSVIEGEGLLLIDSGGQYLGGTTDITRVVPIGRVTAEQKQDFTRVLKGMIALSQACFPEGTPGQMIDALARAPLWQAGLDYGHGTGHGVGYFLNVHEGPQSISPRWVIEPHHALLAGMVVSNEPGVYRPGQWGIRIENLLVAQPHVDTEFGRFLRFETLTLCPIDTRCIDLNLLDSREKRWLNQYHDNVCERLLPITQGAARDWLIARTQAV